MKVFATVSVCFILLTSFVKPRFVDMEEELQNADFVGEVLVRSYGEKYMYYSRLATPTVIDSTVSNHVIAYANYTDGDLTNTWPNANDVVLMVASEYVSLFAEVQKDDYRFWSPYFTGSVAMFSFKAPFRKLPTEDEDTWGDKKGCWDGCLLKKEELVKWRRD